MWPLFIQNQCNAFKDKKMEFILKPLKYIWLDIKEVVK